ncbi:hypothetical protein DFJ74DRAFT_674960 [Hyaloraphidium curvatum]|nr:hypothetical protein DFJ74DRAFT_674960 [Hyaloraphidium curvatum]
MSSRTAPRRTATITPAALLLLMQLDPTPHMLLDVRPPADPDALPFDDVAEEAPPPLPFERPGTTEYCRVPLVGKDETALLGFLQSHFHADPDNPRRDARKTHLVVVLTIAGTEAQTKGVVDMLRWFGFQKIVVLEGGLAAFDPFILSPSASHLSLEEAAMLREQMQREAASAGIPQNPSVTTPVLLPTIPHPALVPLPPRYLSRDALSLLLSQSRAEILDVRRGDERDRFGSIDPHGGWIPVDELPQALADAEGPGGWDRLEERTGVDWGAVRHGGKPLVIHCRTHRRAGWASHLLGERGIRSLVLRDGVWGWGFDPKVQAYPSYEEWEQPPEGKPGTERPDRAKGEMELADFSLWT